jgi:hypothetical protein
VAIKIRRPNDPGIRQAVLIDANLLPPPAHGAEIGFDGIPVSADLRAIVRGPGDGAGDRPHITRTVQHWHINERSFCPHTGFLFEI